jgi:hypothetical protein
MNPQQESNPDSQQTPNTSSISKGTFDTQTSFPYNVNEETTYISKDQASKEFATSGVSTQNTSSIAIDGTKLATNTTIVTPLATKSGSITPSMLTLDQLDPIEEYAIPLGDYLFSNENKEVVKIRSKKRKTKAL